MESEYIPKDDAMKYMEMNKNQFEVFSKKYIKDFKYKNGKTKFYSKQELDYYIELRNDWNKQYLYYEDAVEMASTRKIFETITKQYNLKPIRKPLYAKHIDDKGFSYYHKESLERVIEDRLQNKVSNNTNEYISLRDASKQLGITTKSFRSLIDELNLKTKIDGCEMFLLNADVEKLLKLQCDFLENHMSLNCASDIIGNTRLTRLEKIKIPYYAKKNRDKVMVKISDVEKVKNEVFRKIDGIEKNEAAQKLGLSPSTFYRTTVIFDIKPEIDKSTGKGYYKESDIEFISNQREEFGERYLTFDMVKDEYGSTVASKIRGFKAPPFIIGKDAQQTRVSTLYDRVDAEKIKSEIEQKKLFNTVSCETPYDTFLMKLSMIDELTYLNNSVYTNKKWFEYVYGRLTTSSAGKRTMKAKITGMINASRAIDRMLSTYKVNEFYQLTPRLINPFITGSSESVSIAISQFSISVFGDIKIKLDKTNKLYKGYSVNDLVSPYSSRNDNESDELGDVEIYNFEEYKSLFKFLTDIDYHIDKILNGGFYKNKYDMSQMVYPSIWLYLILHLNNAWRHGDVSTFPRIEIADLLYQWNIDSIEWFRNNKLSISQSKILTTRVIQKEFLISKTQMNGHFFCSDNLAPAFATAVIVLELYLNNMGIFSSDKIDDPLMYFESVNEQPSDYTICKFFEGSKLNGFKFKSKKMNKTVMSFVYSIVSRGDEKSRVLEIVAQLRGHTLESSTIPYLKFNIEEIEFLTELLFRRGEFGYITEKLLDMIGMQSKEMENKSIAIEAINTMFGDYEKVEAVVGLTGRFNSDKNKILKMLNGLKLEEVVDKLIDIYCERLPSKEKNIQCLVSKTGCVNIKKSCKSCSYHIPSLYALDSILSSLREDVQKYFAEKNIGNKMKLTASINRKVEIMGEAVSRYGEEIVYNYLQISRNDFLEIYDNIPDTDDLYNYILDNSN